MIIDIQGGDIKQTLIEEVNDCAKEIPKIYLYQEKSDQKVKENLNSLKHIGVEDIRIDLKNEFSKLDQIFTQYLFN